jgi:hypothetical protein
VFEIQRPQRIDSSTSSSFIKWKWVAQGWYLHTFIVEWRRETNLAWKLFISSGVGPIDLVGRMRSIFHVSIWKDFCVGVVYNTLYQFCSHCSLMEIFTTCLAPPESIHNFLKFICDVATLTPPPNQVDNRFVIFASQLHSLPHFYLSQLSKLPSIFKQIYLRKQFDRWKNYISGQSNFLRVA